MKIDLTRMRTHWFEDKDGNIIEEKENECVTQNTKEDILFYHVAWPCQFTETIDEYCWHPKNPIVKWLCKNRKIYKLLSKGKDKTFKTIMTCNTGFGAKFSQECIVAMVNSGEYTLEQAIWVYTNACERCANVLLHKYLNGKEGYEEYSEEWKKAHASCQFCEEDM